MKYLFVLGRNPELSKAEVFSYFDKEGNKILSNKVSGNGLLIELEKEIGKVVKFLGGVIAVGKVLCSTNEEEMEKVSVYNGTSNKLNYVLWEFGEESKIGNYLKKRFKLEKIKATEKPLGNFIEMQTGKTVRNISRGKLVDEEYFVFDNLFGKINEKSDYDEIEKRDMGKPFRRSDLAISPRLAKIIINLSGVRSKETLLDPFCGIGVVLQEALLQGVKVVGIDKDKTVIEKCKKNLEWANFSKEKYKLINGDSRKTGSNKAEVIVCEPDFGETLRKVPNPEKVKKILLEYEILMNSVLRNLKKHVKGKIVFTAPYVKTNKKRVSCNIEKLVDQTGLIVKSKFDEFREGQIVGRQIFVLE